MTALPPINILWLKRDLRLTDHEPLCLALREKWPLLVLYCFEPSLMAYADSDVRHWRFVHESLAELQGRLKAHGGAITICHNEVLPVLHTLAGHYTIHSIFSHQETGNKHTYDRDIAVQEFCNEKGITWRQSRSNGIVRKLKTRKGWEQRWQATMRAPQQHPPTCRWHLLTLPETLATAIAGPELPDSITTPPPNFQHGGELMAWRYLHSFIQERHGNYMRHISKPALSRKGCSRLSPYLAYGNISVRQVYQYVQLHYAASPYKRDLTNFLSRLRWHCHFIQKFEDECQIEFVHMNRAYAPIVKPRNDAYIAAWQQGKTGVPLVDACMRCVVATKYFQF